MKTLIVATTNKGKLVEIEKCLVGLDWQLKSLADLPNPPVVEEDADTFEGNATKKAMTIVEHYGLPALSDDSGLVVDVLGGAPGVRSARYGAPELNDRGRCEYLLQEMASVPAYRRGCRFQTAVVFAVPAEPPKVFFGTMEGTVALTPRGTSGFGYDPVFIPEGMTQTVAELGPEIKNRISHRAKALAAFSAFLKKQARVEASLAY